MRSLLKWIFLVYSAVAALNFAVLSHDNIQSRKQAKMPPIHLGEELSIAAFSAAWPLSYLLVVKQELEEG